MVRESIAILALGIILLFVFLRARHPGYSLAALPVCVLPLMHLIIRAILYFSKESLFGFRGPVVTAFVDVLALAVSCALIVFIGTKIESKRIRNLYLLTLISYTALLSWAYIFTTLQPLFA